MLLISTVVLSACMVNKVSAQSYYLQDNRTFYGGLSLGTNFTQVQGDLYGGYFKIGFTGGPVVYAELVKNFAISMELLYSQKGSVADKDEVRDNYVVREYKLNFHYIEAPVMLNYFDKRRSHIGVGLAYAQLFAYKEEPGTIPAYKESLDDYGFRFYDINGVVSGSLHLYKGFFLNIRFQHSLISVRDNRPPELYREGTKGQYNNMWVLKLMYIINS